MQARIKQLLSPPVFDDEERARLARSAHIIAMTSLMALLATTVIMLIVHRPIIACMLLAGAGLMVIAFWLTRRGRLQSAMTLILLSILGIVTGVLYAGRGVHDVGAVVYPVVIIMASLLLKPRGVVLIAVLSILSVGFVTLSELNGLVRMALPGATGWDDFVGMAAILIVTAIVGWLMADDVLRSLARSRHELTERTRADGQYRWLLDTVVPRYTADERLAGSIGMAIDITDRKQAEESLQRNEARLRLIHDNMVDTINQIDAQQRVLYVSPSVERVFGLRPRDIVGRSLLDLVHPDDTSQVFHRLLMAIELRAPSIRLEYRYQHAGGYYVWVESEVRLLYDEHGQLTSAVFGSRDISARKRIEQEQARLIQELESKNAELERFTYTVSRDLKSPLITIRGFLGFLEKDAVSGNVARLKSDIARIAEATNRMQRLLNELLKLSRVGRIVNPPQSVPFDAIAREAVELVRGRIIARGVQVEIADSLPMVYGDRARLVEVMQN